MYALYCVKLILVQCYIYYCSRKIILSEDGLVYTMYIL